VLAQVRSYIDLERQKFVFPLEEPSPVLLHEVHKPLFVVDISQADAVSACLKRVCDADTAPCRPYGLCASGLRVSVHVPISRQHKVRPVGDEDSPLPLDTFRFEAIELSKERLGVDHHASTEDDGLVGVQNAGGHKVQGEPLFSQHNGVSRIRSTGKPYDDLGIGCQKSTIFPLPSSPH